MDPHLIDASSSEQEQEDFFTQADDEQILLDPPAALAVTVRVEDNNNNKTANAAAAGMSPPSLNETQVDKDDNNENNKSSDTNPDQPPPPPPQDVTAAVASAPENPEENEAEDKDEAITDTVAAVVDAVVGTTDAVMTTSASEDQEEEEASKEDKADSSYEQEEEFEDEDGGEEKEEAMTFEKDDDKEEEMTPKGQESEKIPAQFAWLRTTAPDHPIWCVSGNKEVEHVAYVVGQPIYDMINNTWVVQVSWDAKNGLKEYVACSHCTPVELHASQRITRSRDIAKPTSIQQLQRNTRLRTAKMAVAADPMATPVKRLIRLKKSTVQSFHPSIPSESPITSPGGRTDVPFKGMKIYKEFLDGNKYWGTVTSGTPRTVERPDGAIVLAWHVRYEDNDQEELELEELMQCRQSAPAGSKKAPFAAATITPSVLDDGDGDDDDDESPLTAVARKLQRDDPSEDETETTNRRSKRARLFQLEENSESVPTAATNDATDEVDRILAEEDERAKLVRFYKWTKEHVCNLPGILPEEAEEALRLIGPPYGLQEVTRKAMEIRDMKKWQEPTALLEPKPGMKVRRTFGGEYFTGTVTEDEPEMIIGKEGKPVKVWKIRFADGDVEDLELDEILRYRYDRPREPAPCRGRALQSLELFSGRGVVTQEFAERKWKVQSIDISWDSNATLITSIMDVRFEELDFTPDFIWASPPCQTYSRLAGGKHRSIKNGELEKSDEALEHNYYFGKMMEIMRKAKKKHPHLIVVIENPQGSLRMMPLMKAFKDEFNLWEVTVNYCAFGRDEKKPTMLWTNDIALKGKLSRFTCQDMCPYNRNGEPHPVGVQQAIGKFDFSVIPQPLAEEVAEYVHSRFFMDDIHWKPAVDPAATDAA